MLSCCLVSGLPAVKEGGNSFGAGVLELLFAFGVEKLSVRIEYGQGGNAFGDGDVVLLRDINVFVHVTDVDVDDDKVFGEDLGVGTLVIVDVEDLAVSTPVAAEVQEDALVLATGADDGGSDVGGGVGGFGVEVLVDVRGGLSGRLRQRGGGEEGKEESRKKLDAGLRDLRIQGCDLIRVHRRDFVQRPRLWRGSLTNDDA